ncbi:hypothetical protein EIN_185170 [Entamoeba invadens IP1]|uniref:hypothetical protein n=1 Tax=Entamoeba invadens IP1 TaxID=370355 RepID=UPI0002C3D212|nr:hypothetical protein EIN_185170 [Entamoeba invadens IP1]ELP94140.1 hypothetical protein EIN_185170 [Entamoeba invadens IP1]|eukprot:XP_004260911.1 hypothetical protein EIN_185170 [Entamoeba invadens IP1]
MSKATQPQPGHEPKMGKVGMLTVKFEDVKEDTVGYIVCDVDSLTYFTKKNKASKNLHVNETLYFPVQNPRANIHFFLYKPRLIGAKCVGFHQLCLADLKESDGKMHYIQSIKKPKNIIEPDIGEVKQTEVKEEGKKKKSDKCAQFNVSIVFTPVPVEEKKMVGIIHEGVWKPGMDAGNIIGNPKWYENPQYLLTLSSKMHVKICLKQDITTNRVTYFIVKYDALFYEGCPLTLYDPNEVIKIDDNFLSTKASNEIEQSFELDAGSYVIIPTNMNKVSEVNPEKLHGKFQIAASCEHMEGIEFVPANLSKKWEVFEEKKVWDKVTNGGADRGSPFEFYHNFQYFLKTEKDVKVSVTMEQADNKHKMGFYLFNCKQSDRKEIDFGELADETKTLISYVCVGKNFTLKKGEYILVPCSSEEKLEGEFIIRIYSQEKIEVKELTRQWSNMVVAEGKWEEGTAGGNVNNPEAFVTNPQYVIKAKYNGEECKDIIFLLSQFIGTSGKIESIGLPIFVDTGAHLEADDVNEDNLINLPEAWVKNKNVFTCFEVDPDDGLDVIAVPSTMKQDTYAPFKITILSDVKDITIEELTA